MSIGRIKHDVIGALAIVSLASTLRALQEPVVLLTADRGGSLRACDHCPGGGAIGGGARAAALIGQQRTRGPVLLLDAGNAFFGSADASGAPGAAVRELYDALGYDVVNISYRDFRHGLGATRALLAGTAFTPVSANLHDAVGERLFEPFTLEDITGQIVAVVGVTMVPPGLDYLPHLQRQLAGVTVADPLEALAETLPAARAGADRVVLLCYADRELLEAVRTRFGAELDAIAVGGLRPGELPAAGAHPCAAASEEGRHVTRFVLGSDAPAELLEVGSELAADPAVEALLADALAPQTFTVVDDARPLREDADLAGGDAQPVAVRSSEPGFGNGLVLGVSSVQRRGEWQGVEPPEGTAWVVFEVSVENDIPAALAFDGSRQAGEKLRVVQKQKLFLLCGEDARTVLPAVVAKPPTEPGSMLPASFVLDFAGDKRAGQIAFAAPEAAFTGGVLQLRLEHDEVPAASVLVRGAVPPDELEAAAGNEYVELAAPAVSFPETVAGRAPPEGARWVVATLQGRSVGTGPAFYLEAPSHLELLVDGMWARRAEPGLGTLPQEPVFLPDRFTGGAAVFLAPLEARSLELSCGFPLISSGHGEQRVPELVRLALEGEPVVPEPELAAVVIEDGPLPLAVRAVRRCEAIGGLRAREGRTLLVLDCRVEARGDGGLLGPSGRFSLANAQPVAAVGAGDLVLEEPFLVPAGARRAFRVVLDAPADVRGPTELTYAGATVRSTFSLDVPGPYQAEDDAEMPVAAGDAGEAAPGTPPELGPVWREHAPPPTGRSWVPEVGPLAVDPPAVSAAGITVDVARVSFATELAGRAAKDDEVFLELEVALGVAADARPLATPRLDLALPGVLDRRRALDPVLLRRPDDLPAWIALEPGAERVGTLVYALPREGFDSFSLELLLPGREGLHVPVLEPALAPAPPFAEASNRAFDVAVLGFASHTKLDDRDAARDDVLVAVELRASCHLAGRELPAGRLTWHRIFERVQLVVDGLWPVPARTSAPTDVPAEPLLMPTEMIGGRIAFELPLEQLAAASSVELVCDFEPVEVPGGGLLTPRTLRFALQGERPVIEVPAALHRVEDADSTLVVSALDRPDVFRGHPPGGAAWWTAELWLTATPGRGVEIDPVQRISLLDDAGTTYRIDSLSWKGRSASDRGRPFWIPAGGTRRFTAAFRVAADAQDAALVHRGLLHVEALPFDADRDVVLPVADWRRASTGQVVLDDTLVPRGLEGVGLKPEEVNRAIDRGRDFLWKRLQEGMRAGELTGARNDYPALLALVHCSAHQLYPELDAAMRRWLARVKPWDLPVYDLALVAMLLDALRDPAFDGLLEDILRCLVESQGPTGSWTYNPTYAAWLLPSPAAESAPGEGSSGIVIEGGEPPRTSGADEDPIVRTQSWYANKDGDNSVSQFAALGLAAAERQGLAVDPETWRGLLGTFGGRQTLAGKEHGGWGYTTDRPYGSMTCSGICSTAIALRRFDPVADPRRDLRVRDGLAWLDRNWSVIENPRRDVDWRYYYLYGLERVGRILDIEFIGAHEWYPEGARFLVDNQGADGAWVGAGGETPPIATSFALLFLTRATESLELDGPDEPEVEGPGTLETHIVEVPGPDRVYVVLDASGSMLSDLGGHQKFEAAREAVRALVAALPDEVELALRAYGHRKRATQDGAAEDTELVVPFAALDRERVSAVLDGLRARGKTPLTLSLEQTTKDLRAAPTTGGTLVLLLTDGGEDTRRDPVPAASALAELPDTRLVVVGFDIQRPEWTRELEAVAVAAHGEYVLVNDTASLTARLASSVSNAPPTFELVDASGGHVAAGTFGDSLALEPGPYTMHFVQAGKPRDADFWIHPSRTTRVRLDRP